MPKPLRGAERPRKEHAEAGGSSREKTRRVFMNTQPAPVHSSEDALHNSQHMSVLSSGPSATGQPNASSSSLSPPPGKVAIPALRPSHATESTGKIFKKSRTTHACNHCRKIKAGCTGEIPCPRCRNGGIDCKYGDGKREAEKKTLSRLGKHTVLLSQHNTDVKEALQRIHLDTALSKEDMRATIESVLAMTLPSSPQDREGMASMSDPSTLEYLEGKDGDSESGVGSTGSVDVVTVDTDREDIRPTGHLGKSSLVAWAIRTAEETQKSSGNENPISFQERNLSLTSYHTEDADVQVIDVATINMFEWPDPHLAHTLVRSYFEHVHNAFPIIDKLGFEYWYTRARPGSATRTEDETIWLGSLNLIFAIAAYHGHLSNSDSRGHHTDHLVFCARAKLLCMDTSLLYQDARISTVCAMGLQCLYYIATVNLNRAWTICGLAIRQALTLGLHVRSEADGLEDIQKEHRVRVWWSLYSLECLLTELTGRPSCISDMDISTPLPINISEDDFRPGQALYERNDETLSRRSRRRGSRNSKGRLAATYLVPLDQSKFKPTIPYSVSPLPVTPSTYFIYHTQLSIISHETVTHLYCPATIKLKWSQVQTVIKSIDQRLQTWQSELPSGFNVNFDTYTPPDWNDPCILPRIGLTMLFNSSLMLLFRPCLCRFEVRLNHQSAEAEDFNQEGVETCILSARRMISLFSWSATSVDRLYTIRPWWATLHYLGEALSILLLEMVFRNQHMPSEATLIYEDVKRGINWLSMMSAQSISARKAWEIFDRLMRQVTAMSGYDIFDMPVEAPMPLGYISQRSPGLFDSVSPQLSQADFRTYQHTQTGASVPVATPAWASQPSLSQRPFGEIPGTFQPAAYASQNFSNPLNYNEALNMFSSIGNVHGLYDDPWTHMFGAGNADATAGAGMYGPSQGLSGSSGGDGEGEHSRDSQIRVGNGGNLDGFGVMEKLT